MSAAAASNPIPPNPLLHVEQLSAASLNSIVLGKRILIVGGTAGIGRALALSCQRRGAQVTVVGRRPWKDATLAATQAKSGPTTSTATAAAASSLSFPPVRHVSKDLSLMRNCCALASELDCNSFDWLVFTNGIFSSPTRQVTSEGIEQDMAVSFLSRYVFLKTLRAKVARTTNNDTDANTSSSSSGGASASASGSVPLSLGKCRSDLSARPRVFVMGYPGHKVTPTLDDFNSERKYSVFPAHMNTVAANEALVHNFASTKALGDVNVFGLAPGLIRTEVRDNLFGKGSWRSWLLEGVIGWFTPTPEHYVENSLIHILASPQLESSNMNGVLIDHKRRIIPPNPFFTKEGNVQKLVLEADKLAERAQQSDSQLPMPSS